MRLSTLVMVSGSFIEDDLCSQCSDMLYSLKSTLGDAYIYCLIEHQSCPEPMMAFRLLRYAVTAMHRHLEQENKQLPVVIPILFYHGSTSPYPYTTHWLDCFADRKLAESVYEKAFPLVDVTAMEDEEILRHRRMALMEIVQKHIRTRNMLELAGELANLLEQWKFSKEQCKTLVYYLVLAGNTTDGEGFLRTLAQPAPSYREDMMTIAEQLEAKGMQKGIQLGEKKGIERGLQEGIQLGKKTSYIEDCASVSS
ncbi:putative transposase (plasmid) [Sodalis glossinidius str. 'morsitans']|uniref:Putative transposase n=1 Tax=Sodalis glossinidius (strain morsitans) TaxID=343509 RepID=A0A193QPM9_SODGM|nr:putative transposase [Sodalis glossinidius str. 'morsitans']